MQDFNPDSGTLHVRPQSQPGKQGKGFHIVLTDEGRTFFEQLVAGRASSEPLLRREWKASDQQRPMRAACERAKIDPPIGFHQLRHTWGSLAIMDGMALHVVAKNLGHADTRMVERHYGHLAPSYVAESSESTRRSLAKLLQCEGVVMANDDACEALVRRLNDD